MKKDKNTVYKKGEVNSRAIKNRVSRNKRIKIEKRDENFKKIISSLSSFFTKIFSEYSTWLSTFIVEFLKILTVAIILVVFLNIEPKPVIATLLSKQILKTLKSLL